MSNDCITIVSDLNSNIIKCPENKFIKEISMNKNKKIAEIRCCLPYIEASTASNVSASSSNPIQGQSLNMFWNNRTMVLMSFVIIMLILLMFLGKNLVTVLLIIAFLMLAKVDVLGLIRSIFRPIGLQ